MFIDWLRGRYADEDAAKWVRDEEACYELELTTLRPISA